ncbi:MAG TPA: YbhB/YbcL family Raf kinase inhibitor-like protein [Pedococcus sp.]|jgi:Raf kinase inhibitor-like YbhB/YbcL family protein|uniref:YbhB/YbcL family Raf kinase inhibitor-like protein n=1 Tax=Pedococcus sp. TaxID=2860345 RepID=UPI002F93D7C8
MTADRSGAPGPYDDLPPVPSFHVSSAAFEDGGTLPPAHTLRGGNTSPPLSWSGAPGGTRGYAVTCFDPDAPGAGFWHWAVFGISPDVTDLPVDAGARGGAGLPEGAFHLSNDFGRPDYGGAAPPRGHGPHRYVFAVHALDTADLRLPGSADPRDALSAAVPHTLARGVVVALYRTP